MSTGLRDSQCANGSVAFQPYGQDLRVLTPSETAESGKVNGFVTEPPGPRKKYKESIRIAYFISQGEKYESIAARFQVSMAFVASCSESLKLSVPKQVPKQMAEHALHCLENGVEPFRPAELRRSFIQTSPDLLRGLSASLQWEAVPALKRDRSTGQIWDTGHTLLRERKYCGLHTGVPTVDRAITQIVKEYGIDDPGAYVLCNRYKDGRAFIAGHQHDYWSATFSFGASRVFLLENRPLLLHDGDLLVFDCQQQSVPKMPKLSDEHISVSLCWYPNWRSDCDYSSEDLERWQLQNQQEEAWAEQRAQSIEMLAQLGCSEGASAIALNDTAEDVDAAADLLLKDALKVNVELERVTAPLHARVEMSAPIVPHSTAKGRWRRDKSAVAQGAGTEPSAN